MSEADDAGTCMVICQGPPRCSLRGERAIAEQVAGCVWCERKWLDEDGRVVAETKPGEC